ncbi:GNAT family N-acetyltransferase [Streptomyces liliifuscus]|uniref:GNAT family N-acetyltransferase n=1 Tax=Streptomyces liliifuscus TaxID=2797636 RepID=A0A7T7L6Z7_9ACTN|nr:GNAT family N-acetyltransferase [Streptomyces liliifuscus]QQM47586.1 GNAT family N-acetyltransferase [Streptomyces liliifuscus]
MRSTRTRLPGITLRDAAPTDADAVMRLLADVNPDDPDAFEDVRPNLSLPQEEPLSHFRALMIVAENDEGETLGVLIGGVPLWLFDHPGIDVPLAHLLAERTAIVTAVAVDPGQRGRGIGAELIRHSVRRFTRAGYGLLTLNCFPELESYYEGLGFSIMDGLNVALGPRNAVGHRWGDTRVAARLLDRYTTFVDVPGLTSPVVSGILPNTRMQRGAYFDGEQFRA